MQVTSENWLQAQYSVLGAALLSENIAARVLTETEEKDYSGPCQTVYLAMRKLFADNAPIDAASLNNVLGGNYHQFLIQLMDLSPTAANVDYHIRLCKEQSRVLAVRDIGSQLMQAENADDVAGLLAQANSCMATRQSQSATDMSNLLKRFMEVIPMEKPNYLTWPIRSFTEGLYTGPGDFVILGAEPSVGKTAFALQCAWHWAKDRKVGFFSFETSPEKLFHRLLSSVAGVSMQNVKTHTLTPDEWDRVCRSTQEITERKLELVSAAGANTADIRFKIMERGYQVVVIDYLQLVSSRGANRYEQVTNISIDLHNIAQSLGVTILALSQLSRSDEDRNPRNSDLRESGQLEQDADVIIMLKLKERAKPFGPRNAVVTKNKEGEIFYSVLDFDGKCQRFSMASRTGEVVSKYVHDGKQARRNNRNSAPAPNEQLTMLPDNTPVPF